MNVVGLYLSQSSKLPTENILNERGVRQQEVYLSRGISINEHKRINPGQSHYQISKTKVLQDERTFDLVVFDVDPLASLRLIITANQAGVTADSSPALLLYWGCIFLASLIKANLLTIG